MDNVTRAERYLFIIALVIAVLVYAVGAEGLIKVGGPQAVNLLTAAQGRTAQGTYPPYASNAPALP